MGERYDVSEHDASEIRRIIHKVDNIQFAGMSGYNGADTLVVGPPPVQSPVPGGDVGGGSSVLWGKLVSLWSPGTNTVTLTPCNSAGTATGASNVSVHVELPVTRTAQYCDLQVGDVVAYFSDESVNFLARNPLPMMNKQYQGWYDNSSDPTKPNVVSDFVRAASTT